MNIEETEMKDVFIIEPNIFHDERGFFLQTFQKNDYKNLGLPDFVQINHSRSKKGVLRGLHYQLENQQGKLVRVTRGEIFDVAVDIRQGSKDFLKWVGVYLSDSNHKQLYIPPGFAHGFLAISDEVDVEYMCTDYYHKDSEQSILYNDDDIKIDWPSGYDLIVSTKDKEANSIKKALKEKKLPIYEEDCI